MLFPGDKELMVVFCLLCLRPNLTSLENMDGVHFANLGAVYDAAVKESENIFVDVLFWFSAYRNLFQLRSSAVPVEKQFFLA